MAVFTVAFGFCLSSLVLPLVFALFYRKMLLRVFLGLEKEIDVDDIGTTEIRLARVNSLKEGKRTWTIQVTHNRQKTGTALETSLEDPLKANEYSDTFRFYADHSFEPEKYNILQEENRTSLDRVENQDIPTYCVELLKTRHLDDPQHESKNRNILIIEELNVNEDDDMSLHNLVWELLERKEYWRASKPERVSVTRILCPRECIHEGRASDKGLPDDRPVRILLVIARKLKKKYMSDVDWKYTELVQPSLVQHSIMQTIRHLEKVGHRRKVQLDILRPATFNELQDYLRSDGEDADAAREEFDIIHLDMHGHNMPEHLNPNEGEQPHLIFTDVPRGPPAPRLVSDVAKALKRHTKLLVMNACNESSPSGQLGIRMIRTFLCEDMACVSATNYRLQETSAKIYYPRFYMSLFLTGSFDKAASEARRALRDNKERYGGTLRDDHFVHWNWSSTAALQAAVTPRQSLLLYAKMRQESFLRSASWAWNGLLLRLDEWARIQAKRWPMYAIYNDFKNLECHVTCAQRLDVPRVPLHALEIEYRLKTNPKHSVYLHPPYVDSGPELGRISDMVRNMARVWVDTNFISEVRVLNVKEMARQIDSHVSFRSCFWRRARYENLVEDAEWCWRQRSQPQPRKGLEIKKMLIIDNFCTLLPMERERRARLLKKMAKVARSMRTDGEDIYVVTIGSLGKEAWQKDVPPDFAVDVLGEKWSGAKMESIIMLPLYENVAVSTYEYME